ncbi:MAG: hypothetical protein Q9181_004571 [Wetmoreana brouardii]
MELNGLMVDPTKVGASPPPPGVTPNLVDPYSQSDFVVATVIVCLIVATPLCWARMYTRIFITRQPDWDDCLSLVAWMGFVVYCVLGLEANRWGLGAHQWNVSLARAATIGNLANIVTILNAPLIFVTKLSILLQYIRIFMPDRAGVTYRTTQLIIWFNLLYYTALMFADIFQCTPREKIWHPWVAGRCINLRVTYIAGATINIVSDVAMLVLPLNAVWHLHMPNKKKWGVSAVFGAGIIACASSILRLYESVRYCQTKDQSWHLLRLGLWTTAELCSGLVIGCLPVMPKFYRHFAHAISTKLTSYRTPTSGGTNRVLIGSSSSRKKMPIWNSNENRYATKREYTELNDHCSAGAKIKPMGRVDPDLERSVEVGFVGERAV